MSTYHCTLTDESLIHLRGSNIAAFLQGQLTCDTREVAATRSLRGAFCNARGRVLADVRVVQLAEEHLVLRLRRSIAEDCAATLATYARFSRIDCTADTGQWSVIALWGPQSTHGASVLGLAAPDEPNAVVASGAVVCCRHSPEALEILVPREEEDSLTAALRAMPEIAEGSADAWDALEIRGGLYRIDRADVGEFTPQAINYDLAGLVSFTKGCYTGQEVIARLHYRGQSKRRLGVFAPVTPNPASAADAPPRGEPVLDDTGERVGELLRAARTSDGDTVLACQLRAEAVGRPNLLMAGTPLRPMPVPYPDSDEGAAG